MRVYVTWDRIKACGVDHNVVCPVGLAYPSSVFVDSAILSSASTVFLPDKVEYALIEGSNLQSFSNGESPWDNSWQYWQTWPNLSTWLEYSCVSVRHQNTSYYGASPCYDVYPCYGVSQSYGVVEKIFVGYMEAQRTKSSRLEGPKTGQKGHQLEVAALRAPLDS